MVSSVHQTPRNGKLSENFRPYYPVDPNLGYSFVQNDSQQTSEGLYRETTVGKLLIDAMTRYVIGKGLTPMSAPESDLLGWDDGRLATFRKQSEAYWRLVTNDPNFDFYGKDGFKQLQQIAFRNILISGDTLRHIGYRRIKSGRIVPYVQIISGRMLSQEWEQDTLQSTGGVIINKSTGKEVGYTIRVIADDRYDTGTVKKVSRYNSLGRLEFDLISLGKTEPGLVRGIPLLTTLRDDILDFNKFKSNHILQSAVQSLFTAFIEKSEDAKEGAMSFRDKLTVGVDEADVVDEGRKVDLGAGYVVELEPGEHVNLVQRQAQGDDFDAYTKSVIGLMASSLGMSYEVAMNSFNASFSASRAGISGAEKNFAILREEFAEKFCQPVWRQVIEHGILTGDIECSEWESLSPIQRKALFSCTWTGVTPPQVDPAKEVNAYVLAVQNGLCTREYAIRMLFGMDYEEVAERLAEEENILPDSLKPQTEASTDEEENEDEE